MGNYLNCVSCVERERDGATQPLYSARSYDGSEKKHTEDCQVNAAAPTETNIMDTPSESQEQVNVKVGTQNSASKKSPVPTSTQSTELQDQINSIVNGHRRMRHVPCTTENALKEQINAIVAARSQERMMQSPVPFHADAQESIQSSVPSYAADGPLQDEIGWIVHSHANSLKQQRLDCMDESAMWASPYSDWASPSPTPMTDVNFAYPANIVLSNAREPAVPETCGLWSYEDDVAPCQLTFADADEAAEPQKPNPLQKLDSPLTQTRTSLPQSLPNKCRRVRNVLMFRSHSM